MTPICENIEGPSEETSNAAQEIWFELKKCSWLGTFFLLAIYQIIEFIHIQDNLNTRPLDSTKIEFNEVNFT